MTLWGIIKEDFSIIKQKDPALNSSVELFFNYPGLIALVHYRIAHRFYKAGFKILARILMGLTGFITNVDIHPAAIIGRRVFIDHATGVVIGETAEVGNDVMIYQGVTLGGTSLDKVKRHPTIEDGVVIGAGAIPARVIVKGRAQGINAINKLPDIDRALFEYLFKRIQILESTQDEQNCTKLKAELQSLDEIYAHFLQSLKG